jgi:hypothetical protein
MDSAFATWIGRPVVLRVAVGESRVGVRGMLLRDGAHTLRVRLVEGLDIDIYKEMVLAVEEDPPLFLMSRRQCD